MFATFTAEELSELGAEILREMTVVTAAVKATCHDLDAQTPLFDYHSELSDLHSEVSDAHDLRVALDIFAAGGTPSWQPRTARS
jgi:hypothetical protein